MVTVLGADVIYLRVALLTISSCSVLAFVLLLDLPLDLGPFFTVVEVDFNHRWITF